MYAAFIVCEYVNGVSIDFGGIRTLDSTADTKNRT